MELLLLACVTMNFILKAHLLPAANYVRLLIIKLDFTEHDFKQHVFVAKHAPARENGWTILVNNRIITLYIRDLIYLYSIIIPFITTFT